MTTAKPPVRYSAMESARPGDFATPELHHHSGHDLPMRAKLAHADGRSAYIRVDPKAAEHGTAPVLGIAKARQSTGEIPDGEIVSVQRVK